MHVHRSVPYPQEIQQDNNCYLYWEKASKRESLAERNMEKKPTQNKRVHGTYLTDNLLWLKTLQNNSTSNIQPVSLLRNTQHYKYHCHACKCRDTQARCRSEKSNKYYTNIKKWVTSWNSVWIKHVEDTNRLHLTCRAFNGEEVVHKGSMQKIITEEKSCIPGRKSISRRVCYCTKRIWYKCGCQKGRTC